MQARLEEARNALADEAMAYYPEVSMNRRLYKRSSDLVTAETAGFEGGREENPPSTRVREDDCV